MSTDIVIAKCTRRCAVSGRQLEPGESFISELVSEDGQIVRLDIAASAWDGPRPNSIGWWRCRMPEAAGKKLRPAPSGVLLDTLSDLLEQSGKEPLAYMLGLLLARRRLLIEVERLDADEQGDPKIWNVTCSADGRQWNIPIVEPLPEQMVALKAELNDLLFIED
jgi:hypothetical protein